MPQQPTMRDGPIGARFRIRALARSLDLIFIEALLLVGYVQGAFFLEALGVQRSFDASTLPSIGLASVDNLLSLLMVVFYFTAGEFLGGKTPGKLICGLRVVAADGGPPSVMSVVARNVAVLIDGFGLGLVAYFAIRNSPQRQRLGDRWAQTIVLTRNTPSFSVFQRPPRVRLGIAVAVIGTVLLGSATVVAHNWYGLLPRSAPRRPSTPASEGLKVRLRRAVDSSVTPIAKGGDACASPPLSTWHQSVVG